MEKFKGKYRIPSARAPWHDYAANGLYFITICTAGRDCLFGAVQQGQVVLSPIGVLVQREWDRSFDIRAELMCDAFVLMPNHLHAILRIDSPVETHGRASVQPTAGDPTVETHGPASLQSPPPPQSPPPQSPPPRTGVAHRTPRSISSFVAGFKSSATKHINEHRNTPRMPVWQTRFHDRIIRNEAEYQRIATYIANNPALWKEDKFYVP